jgi:hypothetical protein
MFVLVNIFLLALRWEVESLGSGFSVLLIGNCLLFLATGLSFYLYSRALHNNNVQVFLRMMYSSLLLKMVICLSGALVYFYLAGKAVSRTGILGCFGLYILYTFVEVKVLMRLSKQQKNA